jgi:hypothetical protein
MNKNWTDAAGFENKKKETASCRKSRKAKDSLQKVGKIRK